MNNTELHLDLERRLKDHVRYVGNLVPDSPEWHAQRNAGIGSSTTPVVMGASPFKSAVQEWAERTGRQEPEIPSPDRAEMFLLGNLAEPMVASRFELLFPDLRVFDTGSWANIKYDWLRTNPDRIYYNPKTDTYGILELKTSARGTGWNGDMPPIYYLIQVKQQLLTLGLEEAYICVVIGNSETKCYKIHLDANKPIINCFTGERVYERTVTERAIVECCEGFLGCVATDTMPRIDGSVSAWKTIQNIGPDSDKSLTYDTGQDVRDDLVSKYRAKEAATEAYNQARAQLFSDMGDAYKARYVSDDGTRYPFATKRKGPGGRYTLYLTGR